MMEIKNTPWNWIDGNVVDCTGTVVAVSGIAQSHGYVPTRGFITVARKTTGRSTGYAAGAEDRGYKRQAQQNLAIPASK
jgi:hypothetical protein